MVATSVAAAVGESNRNRDEPGVGERYWTPGDPDFGTASPPRFEFADPHAAGLFHAGSFHAEGTSHDIGDRITIHNRGVCDAAAVVLLADGSSYLELLTPGSEIVLPECDSLTYVQAPRTTGGRPVLYGAVWVRSGRVMPVTLPIPTRREFLDARYLTPWSAEWNGGVSGRQILDAAAAGISYQYRTGGSTFVVRNSGRDWIGVVHRSGTDITFVECPPGERVCFELSPHAARAEVFSVVGRRVGGTAGHGPYMSPSGTVHPGWAGRPGEATAYGSVVVMLGAPVYSALPKRNLYMAFSDRRRGGSGPISRRGGAAWRTVAG
ncbi:hypothetical protein GTC6_00670 [Gordonia terrae C-6]|uniref:Uncharacterized protein n=1 Tax=Gordonia terrae C-6 TaxID=1316928 RepID=R7YFE7_9ACTN|nr:hypothetical protein [Gordonia terrae]EON34723.1 hypothetical protein GTC6_00670 [Gordonia terrae C-6]